MISIRYTRHQKKPPQHFYSAKFVCNSLNWRFISCYLVADKLSVWITMQIFLFALRFVLKWDMAFWYILRRLVLLFKLDTKQNPFAHSAKNMKRRIEKSYRETIQSIVGIVRFCGQTGANAMIIHFDLNNRYSFQRSPHFIINSRCWGAQLNEVFTIFFYLIEMVR